MLFEFLKFIIYSGLIVLISKFVLVTTLRKLAESMQLKSKTVGNIAGIATSIPELLTVTISSANGLFSATIFNVLSSNIINFIQYIFAILSNKNTKSIKNKAIIIDILLVITTIIIPLLIVILKIDINILSIPIFLILYILFIVINNKSHKKYFKKENIELEKNDKEKNNKNGKRITIYIITILIVGLLLYIIGEMLGKVLENLSNVFNISQMIIGVLLGFITSIPELITFFESQKHHKNKENDILGVIEATNNLLSSNTLNLFIIQSIGVLIYMLMSF